MKKKKPNEDPAVDSERYDSDFLIAGIGASAGGIQALSSFFSNTPVASGIAYVVILHLSPSHESKLAHVLQQTTNMPVSQVNEKTRIMPNHVYVVSPDRSLSMEDGSIIVKPLHSVEERRAPVDIFFRTLAESHGPNAVGVILSGTGANGSMGLKRIKEFGGATFAQNPREAEFNEMPRNAIATELVDSILPVAEIPAKILAYRDTRANISIADEPEDRSESQQKALREIFTQLRVRTGHDFSNYKRPTILRRIERRISLKDLPDIQAYAAYLRDNPDEAQFLLKDLLISVTNFFRDKKSFEALDKKVVPRLLKNRDPNKPIRIWVAGCATGEEAYSLAMILAERTLGDPGAPPVQIFATDIDQQSIAVAREGLYTLNDAADVSPERLRRFFTKEGEHYRIRREIREMVLFAQHNLIKDPPFSHLDLITCRNLMIYFNQTAQERVLETAHFALEPGGFLFIGSSESVDGAGDLFAAVDKGNHIYQSRQVTSRPLPVPESVPVYRSAVPARATHDVTDKADLERISYNDLHLRLLEEFSPPSIVVNPDYDIVHISDNAGRYLQVAGGEPTNNLLRLVRPDIRLELRGALFQAVQQRTNVEASGLQVKFGDKLETVNLLIRPILSETDTSRGYILVVFEPVQNGKPTGAPAEYVPPEPVAQQLEEELMRSRSQLQAALEQAETQSEELRASNEELQAMNEELRSSAEELETSKEELQSINEELTTVNQELKVKIEELSHTNNNFQNLLNSIDIGVIFLDRSLRINLFSPAARRIFNLIPNDVGRPLSDITSHITYDNLAHDADIVIESLQTLEREVHSMDDRVFVMSLVPYRTADDRINGVVATFLDITERKRAEERLQGSEEKYRRLFNTIDEAFCLVDVMYDEKGKAVDYRFLEVNPSFERQTGIKNAAGKRMRKLQPRHEEFWFETYGRIAETGRSERFEGRAGYLGGRWYDVFAFRVGNPEERRIGILFNDITARRKIESALRISEERLRLLMESLTDTALFTTDTESIITAWNPGSQKIFGYTAEEMIGKQSADIIFTPEDREKGEARKEREIALRDGKALDERWHIKKNGERFFASGFMMALTDGEKHVGFGKIAQDLTERAQAEQAVREREMLRRIVEAQEEERQRLARDLHDQLGQQLTGLRLKLEGIRANYGAEPAMIKAIDEAQYQAKEIDDEVSFMTWELRPTALDNMGLRNALGAFLNEWSKNYGIEAEFHTSGVRRARLVPDIEINLYRIAQEALHNVVKHAKATRAAVLFEVVKPDVVLVIEDNGIGFEARSRSRRSNKGKFGLTGMTERAALLGGSLEIESAKGKGTSVIVRVPMRTVEEKK